MSNEDKGTKQYTYIHFLGDRKVLDYLVLRL